MGQLKVKVNGVWQDVDGLVPTSTLRPYAFAYEALTGTTITTDGGWTPIQMTRVIYDDDHLVTAPGGQPTFTAPRNGLVEFTVSCHFAGGNQTVTTGLIHAAIGLINPGSGPLEWFRGTQLELEMSKMPPAGARVWPFILNVTLYVTAGDRFYPAFYCDALGLGKFLNPQAPNGFRTSQFSATYVDSEHTGPAGASGIGVPTGGTLNQVLGKTSNADYATSWRTPTVYAPYRRPMSTSNSTAITPALTDENSMMTLGSATPVIITLPSSGVVPFPTGAEIDFIWLGSGQVTFVGGAGVSVYGTPGLNLRAQYSAATAKKLNTTEWLLIGDLSA